MILQAIWRRVVSRVPIDLSLSNILPIMYLTERFHQYYQAAIDRCEYYHSCIRVLPEIVICIYDHIAKNYGIKNDFTKYMNKIC